MALVGVSTGVERAVAGVDGNEHGETERRLARCGESEQPPTSAYASLSSREAAPEAMPVVDAGGTDVRQPYGVGSVSLGTSQPSAIH